MALWLAGAYAIDRKRKAAGQNGLLPALRRASGYGSGGSLNTAIKTYGKNVANAAKYHANRGLSSLINKHIGNTPQANQLKRALKQHINSRINNVHNSVKPPI
jgi:gamma-glutamyl:cysteine ligase YbdK (ATP-grasp superfamily)